MSTKRYSVDRVEGRLAVLVGDGGERLELSLDEYQLSVNDIVDISFSGEKIRSVIKNDAERDRRLSENRRKFDMLFKKRK